MSTMTISPTSIRTRPTVRLTRRGRAVVFAASLLLVLGIALIVLGGTSVASGEAGTPEPTTTVMVGPGETLWDIAAEIAPDGHTRAMMNRIERLNTLDSSMLLAGQRLRVPVE